MTRAVVSLGSNLGDRLATLSGAVERLSEFGAILSLSRLYETAPIGGPEQGPFYNAIAIIETDLSASDLLAGLHEVEGHLDRRRDVHWGPRTLDLDLILHGTTVIQSPTITVPHPLYRERRFVMEPLIEVWPEAEDPDGTALAPLLAGLHDQEIRVVDGTNWPDHRPRSRVGGALVGRGGGWVIGQMLVLVAFLAVVALTTDQLSHDAYNVAGGLVAGVGVVVLVVALTDLDRMTTPFPEPLPGGGLVGSGVYGWVRHPMYAAVVLITIGLAGLLGSRTGVLVWPLIALFFAAKSRHEERRLEAAYPEYEVYRREVRGRLIPRRVLKNGGYRIS